MPSTRSSILYLSFLIFNACKGPGPKQTIANEICQCLESKSKEQDFIASVQECSLAAMEKNKALMAKELGVDSLSNSKQLDFTVEMGKLLYDQCDLVRKNKAKVDSAYKSQLAASKDVKASMQEAMKSSFRVEGRFKDIKQVAESRYDLYLMVDDSVVVFKTTFSLNEMEISLLKKKGNNITLNYRPFNNPVTKVVDKIATAMQPIYEW